jgi:hypothetical protein
MQVAVLVSLDTPSTRPLTAATTTLLIVMVAGDALARRGVGQSFFVM